MYEDDDDGKDSVVDDLPAGNNATSAGGSGGIDGGQDVGDGNSNGHSGRTGTDSAADSATGSTTGSPELGVPKVPGEGSRVPANHSSGASRKQLSSTTGSKALSSSRSKKPT